MCSRIFEIETWKKRRCCKIYCSEWI